MIEIADVLKGYVDEEYMLFATSNLGSGNSSDLDIYVVVKEPAKSQVAMFYGPGELWHEIFIDTEADLAKKLSNFDEIVINFLTELTFSYGDKKLFEVWRQKAIAKSSDLSKYPMRRILILEYRIKVLYSKYMDSSNDMLTKNFLLNSLNYHIAYLLLLKQHVLPSSPKRWVMQLSDALEANEKSLFEALINQNINADDLRHWVKELTVNLSEMHIDKSKGNNTLTFIS